MNYKALYRTYRPQQYNEVTGQQHVVKTLQNAVKENRIGHAYLFCGPRGTGKTTIAKLFAKSVNCTGETKPCEACENCKQITLGSHPDVIEIDAASNNGVDEVRNLIDKVKYAPSQGKYKVYIIDEVHMMSQGAFNALLKTLEEPPAHVIFILATTEPHKILPTIISRCQRFDFTKIEDQDIVNRLKTVIESENLKAEESALQLIAKLADGGMRDALSILEQCLAYKDENQEYDLTEKQVSSVYGVLSVADKLELVKYILNKDMKSLLSYIEKIKHSGTDIKRLTFDMIDLLKDIVIYRNTKDVSLLSVLNKNDAEMYYGSFTNDFCFECIDILIEASEKYARVINPNIYFEVALLKLAAVHEQMIVETKNVVVQQLEQSPVQNNTIVEDSYKPENITIEQPLPNMVMEEEVPVFEFEQQNEVTEDISNDILVDKNDIINILISTKLTYKNEILEKWPIIDRYKANLNTAKSACMLSSGQVVAASADAFIVSFESQAEANLVNYSENYFHLKKFLKDVLGNEYDFIALTDDTWKVVANDYIQMKRENRLPVVQPVVLHHLKEEENEGLNDAQKYAVELFGDDVEFE